MTTTASPTHDPASGDASSDYTVAQVLYDPPESELRFLPEGPFAIGPGKFLWVGIQHGASANFGSLNIFNTATRENRSYRLPGRPGFARPTENEDEFIAGAERELGIFNVRTGKWTPLCTGVDAQVENTIINDATTWQGNIIFGCKDLEFKTKKAGLYLYRARDRSLIQLRSDQICSNGKAVVQRADGGLDLLDIDTPTRKVVRYDLDIAGGKLGPASTVIDLESATGFPDGMVLSPDGRSAIISFYNPDEADFGLTQRYSLATGRLEHSWRTPGSPQNTCPLLLAMPDGSTKLVITTAVEHMPIERQSRAKKSGCLFIADYR
jgi:sugar lactone lactonase YvrE